MDQAPTAKPVLLPLYLFMDAEGDPIAVPPLCADIAQAIADGYTPTREQDWPSIRFIMLAGGCSE